MKKRHVNSKQLHSFVEWAVFMALSQMGSAATPFAFSPPNFQVNSFRGGGTGANIGGGPAVPSAIAVSVSRRASSSLQFSSPSSSP